jgi:uncharacterized spore protein YtfJ
MFVHTLEVDPMRKILAAFVAVTVTFAAVGCGGDSSATPKASTGGASGGGAAKEKQAPQPKPVSD